MGTVCQWLAAAKSLCGVTGTGWNWFEADWGSWTMQSLCYSKIASCFMAAKIAEEPAETYHPKQYGCTLDTPVRVCYFLQSENIVFDQWRREVPWSLAQMVIVCLLVVQWMKEDHTMSVDVTWPLFGPGLVWEVEVFSKGGVLLWLCCCRKEGGFARVSGALRVRSGWFACFNRNACAFTSASGSIWKE